ncbi:hypothetical protein HAX54_051096, partial [Datura stramonium]|nr:hypothetical protein [Datura stramonium]
VTSHPEESSNGCLERIVRMAQEAMDDTMSRLDRQRLVILVVGRNFENNITRGSGDDGGKDESLGQAQEPRFLSKVQQL